MDFHFIFNKLNQKSLLFILDTLKYQLLPLSFIYNFYKNTEYVSFIPFKVFF